MQSLSVFLDIKRLLIFGKKMLMSAELKGVSRNLHAFWKGVSRDLYIF